MAQDVSETGGIIPQEKLNLPNDLASLREREFRYRTIVEEALQGILIHQDGIIVFVNASTTRMFGYDRPEELIGRKFWETLVAPDFWPVLQARSARLLLGEKMLPHPGWRGLRKDGSTIWISANASALTWQGKPALVAFYMDVSERKKVERREQHYREILEQLATGKPLTAILEAIVAGVEQESQGAQGSILLLDREGRHLLHGAAPRLPEFYNQAVHGLEIGLGVGSCGTAAFTGQRVVVEDIQAHPYWAPYRELAKKAGLGACWSEPIVSSTNQILGTFAIYHPSPQAPGSEELENIASAAHLASIAIERARTEEALRQSEERLRLAQQAAHIGAFEWNIQTGVNFWTQELEEMYGLMAGSFARTQPAWEQLVHADDRAQAVQKVQQALETGWPVEGEWRVVWPDGSTHWIAGRFQAFMDESGRPARLSGINLDITARKNAEEERRKLEAQLQHSQKLESLGVLAGGIAHDFNNLLMGILGYADLALLELPAHVPARQLIGEAVKGVRRAADLTNQMLAYSGKGRFVVEPLNLSTLIEDMTRLLEISISKKCLLKFDFMPDLPAVEGDAAQLRQIIMNLVINASEAIGDRSGVIAVTTGVMHCDRQYLSETYLDESLAAGLFVFLEVADNGCGMSEETRRKIFDPFFTTKFTGRGLGLAAVLGIVRGHHGAIKTYSELGKGTTFKVLFPATSLPTREQDPRQAATREWRGSGTVLVVDDEESLRGLAQHMMQAMGFSVLTAANGREALEIFRREAGNIRLVLLDMTMPQMDGEETFRELRRLQPDVCAILTSGYNEQTATSRFAGKGLAGFIQKPYRFEDLVEVIRKVLERPNEREA